MSLLTEALILGLFAMSLDLMVGYTRLVSFGHAAAYGFGAYACSWLLLHTSLPMLATIPISALLAGAIAVGVVLQKQIQHLDQRHARPAGIESAAFLVG